jgi:hypothetical protein
MIYQSSCCEPLAADFSVELVVEALAASFTA